MQHNVKSFSWQASCMSKDILLLFFINVVMTNSCEIGFIAPRCVSQIHRTKTNKPKQLSELRASKQTRTDVLITARQICYGKTFYAPLYPPGRYLFLAVCLPSCSSAFSQICQGRLLVRTPLVTVLQYSNLSLVFCTFGWNYLFRLKEKYVIY